jgi:hypothetical protein
MTVNERALHIQLESYRQALSELSARMAETVEKHIEELKLASNVQADLEARLQEVSASALRAVQLHNEVKANSEEVIAKVGKLTVDNRDLRNELEQQSDQRDRHHLISAYLFRVAIGKSEFGKLPQPKPPFMKLTLAERTFKLDETFDNLLDRISETYKNVPTAQLRTLIGG